MENLSTALEAVGLEPEDRKTLEALLNVYDGVKKRNEELRNYYEGDITPPSIGIDNIPTNVTVDMQCDWPRKAVTSVSERARLDCFTFAGNDADPTMSRIAKDNDLVGSYNRHVSSELTQGCMFGTVNGVEGKKGTAAVRFHTAETAAGIFDVANSRLASGFAIADMKRTPWSETKAVPVQLNMQVPGAVVMLKQFEYGRWVAEKKEHPLDRPLMELFAFRPTGIKPFGQTRITKTVRNISDEVVRTLQNMAISAAFYAHPQKYLMGLTEESYDAMVTSKWKMTIDSMLLATRDDDGNVPVFGQLPAVSPQPYIEIIRSYAALFSGATGVPLNSLGIVQDNPSSAEAIAAAREDICIAAQDLIESNSVSLRNVALMAMAVAENKTIDELSDQQKTVMAHFKDPSMPSIVSQADAMVKIASVDEAFAGTSVFYEQMGFDEATRRRIMSEKVKNENRAAINALFGGGEGQTSNTAQPQEPRNGYTSTFDGSTVTSTAGTIIAEDY